MFRFVVSSTSSSVRAYLRGSPGCRIPVISALFSTQAQKISSESPSSAGVFKKVACIGTGKMAQALIQPMVRTGLQPASDIYVYDVDPNAMETMHTKYGVHPTNSIAETVNGADLILAAVKPQNLTPRFFAELRKGQPSPDAILLSVIAGKGISVFEHDGGYSKVVRSMPNTPAIVGEGMTVWSCTDNLTVSDREKIEKVLDSCGKQMYVDSEQYIDMATSISGSGPAYIFLLMESLIDGAVHMGFPREKGTFLVYHTMLGSTLYAMQTGEHPAILRNMVTSPQGTTASALYELEKGKIRTVIKDAMWACYRRSLEMGNQDSNVGPGRHVTQISFVPDAHGDDLSNGKGH